jgi:hypothetical protein
VADDARRSASGLVSASEAGVALPGVKNFSPGRG